ncbi:MAG TPA: hypothetical protein VK932_18440 [Kofleriaceae bacterium]|nr:hypothetical protein [Kofleriaceae bacterium]
MNMRRSPLAPLAPLAALALALLGGCPSPEENAPVLWLALDGRETEVKLVDYEPPPF